MSRLRVNWDIEEFGTFVCDIPNEWEHLCESEKHELLQEIVMADMVDIYPTVNFNIIED